MVLALNSAFLAMRHAVREPLFLKVFKARIVVGKLCIEIIDRVPQMRWNCLSPVHASDYALSST